MSESLVTQVQLGDLIRRIRALEQRIGRTEVRERLLSQQGVWTPVLAGDTTAGSFTYGAENGAEFTRHGNRVFINGRVRISAVAVNPAGALRITGLPFVAASSASAIAGGVEFSLWHGITLTAGRTELGGRILGTLANIQFIESGSGVQAFGVLGAAFGLLGGFADFQFFGQYRV